ncbi:MAG TPA: penicillin-binding protein activator [Anaeromyxobacteraceae bacterium]|nr:penicillin-binding protein activator [Anaeromyxobacteraceae bacterium]
MRRASPVAALALAFLALACASAPPPVPPRQEGLPPPVATAPSPEAARELQRLRADVPGLPPEKAAEAFERLARRYPAASEAAEALLEGARWRQKARQPARAVEDLGELLSRYPLSPLATQARFQYGLADLEAGRTEEGLQTLVPLFGDLPRDQKGEAASRIAASAETGKAWKAAIEWRGQAAEWSQGVDRDREVARAVELLDTHLSFAEVEQLDHELAKDSPLAPAVSMKLVRVYLHLGEAARAEEEARRLVERWPQNAYAAEAKALLERFERRGRADPRLVGVAVPLSGKFKGWGDAILQGVQLALPEGSGFKIAAKDTRGESDGTAQALEQLAAEGAVAVIGAVTNAEAQRAALTAQALSLPLVSLSKVEGITEAGPYVFRLMLTSSAQAAALADFAVTKRGLKRFAVLYPDIPYGTELMAAFWAEVEAKGGEFRGAGMYEPDRTTFGPLVKDLVGKSALEDRADWAETVREIVKNVKDPYRRAKALEKARKDLPPIVDFDAIFIPDFAKNVTLLAPALAVDEVVTTCDPKELERIRKTSSWDVRPVQLLGANGWDDPSLFEKAGRYVECAIFVDGFFSASERPETKRFVQSFQERYGRVPSILEASAYDAARMLAQVVTKDRAEGRDAVRAALSALRAFPGATGDLSFDARGEPVRALFFLTVDKVGVRELRPDEIAASAGNP